MNTERDLKQIIYQESGTYVRQHESMLFQRLNYFLVAIAFLVAGFVELAVNSAQHDSNTLRIGLTVLVGTTGFVISWFFTAINYFNGTTLINAYEFAEQVEDDLFNNTFDLSQTKRLYRHINKELLASGRFKFDLKTLLYDCIVASIRIEFNTKEREPRAPHTWIIPFCFILFWLAALSIYCSFVFAWWTTLIIIGIPMLIVALYDYNVRKKNYQNRFNSLFNRAKIN
jgi:hypothetical protein